MPKNIVISTFATSRYAFALPNFGRRIVSCIHHAKIKKGTFLFVGDSSDKIKIESERYIKNILPHGWTFELLQLNIDNDDLANYELDAQLLIAQLQGSAFTRAKQLDADYFWSVESDVLPAINALSTSLDALNFDNGYYSVCMSTYPSQGGGSFLGGFGDYRHAIAEDFLPEEREIPEDELKAFSKLKEKVENLGMPQSEKEHLDNQKQADAYHKLLEKIKEYPPKADIFALNSKNGWRRRGWMENAYPAIGKGALLPTDWVGFGCTLMNRKALAFADFEGYEGRGTQDLFVCWHRWHPNDIKMCVNTHAISDHIVRARGKDNHREQNFDKIIHAQAYHEPEGEYRGHLRQRHTSFLKHTAGETIKDVNAQSEIPLLEKPKEKASTVKRKRRRSKEYT